MKELNEKIEQWAVERELDKKGTVEGQAIKTAEELAELIKGISKGDINLIKDSIGDVYVTLVIGNMLYKRFDLSRIYIENEDFLSKIEESSLSYNKSRQIRLLAFKIREIIENEYVVENLRNTQYLLLRIAKMYNLDFKDCVEAAYTEIANRKGKTVNGTFVKEEDL